MKYPIPKETLQQNIVALGKTGAGKSSALRSIVEPMLDDKLPICIIDPKGDWWGIKLKADGKRPGYPLVIFGGKHADVPINDQSGKHIAELFAQGNRPCVIDLRGWMPAARSRFFIDFASTLFEKNAGKRWLLMDECHNFAPKGKVLDPLSGQCLHWANRLASEGRGLGVNIIGASQRPQKVHNDFLTSCETLIAMRVLHASDRDAYKDWIDGCGDPAKGKALLSTIANLKRGTGFVWSPEIEFGPDLVKFPMFATYDSFKPQDEGQAAKLTGWAEVNLDEVKAKLQIVVQEAEANDPRKLKARIAELEKQLKLSNLGTHSAADIVEARRTGERSGFEEGASATTIEVANIAAVMRSVIDNETQNILQSVSGFIKALSTLDTLKSYKPLTKTVYPGEPGHPNPIPPTSNNISRLKPVEQRIHDASTDTSPSVRKILDVVHRSFPVSLSFDAAARRAAISNRSSAYRKYRAAVESSPEVELKDGKLRSLPQYANSSPLSPDAGVGEWVSKLPPAYGKMLRVIHEQGPVDKGRIAELAGVSKTSSGLGTGLRELSSLQLIRCDRGLYQLADGLS